MKITTKFNIGDFIIDKDATVQKDIDRMAENSHSIALYRVEEVNVQVCYGGIQEWYDCSKFFLNMKRKSDLFSKEKRDVKPEYHLHKHDESGHRFLTFRVREDKVEKISSEIEKSIKKCTDWKDV